MVLVCLTGFSVHREAVYADETAVSGSMVVICGCIVGLGDASLTAPLLCAVAAALHRDHVRNRQVVKLAVNLGATVLPALLATGVFRSFGEDAGMRGIGAIAAVATYWLANNAVVGLALGIAYGRVRGSIAQLVRSDTVMLVFGFGGALCGVVMIEVGTWTGVATLVALLVALDVFVISVPAGLSSLRSAWAVVLARGISGGVAGAVGAVVTRAVAISVLGAMAGLAAGVLAGVGVVVLVIGLRLLAMRGRVDTALMGGLALVELTFPLIGALSGVVTAIAGLDAGLVCASSLVVVGSLVVAFRRRRSTPSRRPIDEDTLMVAVAHALLEGLPSTTRER